MYYGTPPIVTNGLVLNLDAANTKSYVSGSTTWRDLSGNSNSGTLTSSSFNATNGGNIIFPGTGSFCDFSAINFPDTTAFTAETVIVIPTFSQTSNRVHWLSGAGGNSMMIFRSAEFFMFNEAGGINALAISYTFNINTIYHVVVTRDTSNNVSLYINGIFVGSGTRSGQFRWVTMGRLGSGTAFCSRFNSYTNKIYNRALTQQEVTQNYNALKSRFI